MDMFEQSGHAERLKAAIRDCDSVIVGAGAGLSTAAGLTYTGERFERYFGDFAAKYGFRDMYSGGFYPYPTPEEHWAYWSRYIWINRYAPIPKDTYAKLRELVGGKDHFVITTNVDHCFQRTGFDKKRLFYTQGDYGLFQCSLPCRQETWDNHDTVLAMVESQGFMVEDDGALFVPDGVTPAMKIPGELVPMCPHCGRPATTNLRADSTFVEDAGWQSDTASFCAPGRVTTRRCFSSSWASGVIRPSSSSILSGVWQAGTRMPPTRA